MSDAIGLPAAFPGLLAPEHVFFDSLQAPAVQAQIKVVLGKKKWFSEVISHSRYFRQVILSQICNFQVPREIFYLVMVESEFNPNAFSRSGAAGLWQFMPGSTPPKMRMDMWQDERYDFVKASRSALEKLVFNHSAMSSWSAALGAYNCGLGRMRQLWKSLEPGDYWDEPFQAALPAETRQYVPRILACSYVGSHAGRLGIELSWGKAVYWDTLVFDRPARLDLLAQKLGITMDLVLLFNPEYRFETPAPDANGYGIRLPRELADLFIKNQES